MASTSPAIDLVDWAGELLRILGYPTTGENHAAIVAWALAEGGHNKNTAAWNPLNTSKSWPGAVTINSHGVKAYPSRDVGLAATAATIRLSYYTAVVAAFRSNAGAPAIAEALWNGGRNPRWGTDRALMLACIPGARSQVTAHGITGVGSTGGTGGTPTTPPVAAGGPLAGPPPDKLGRDQALPTTLIGPDWFTAWGDSDSAVADLRDAIVACRLSVSTSEVSILEVTVADPDLELLRSGIFRGDPSFGIGPLAFRLATLEVGAGDAGTTITATMSSVGVAKLRGTFGPILVENQSPSEFVAMRAHAAGLLYVGEQSPKRPGVGVKGYTPAAAEGGTAQPAESVWDAMQRMAGELGYLCFEAAGVVYFARPSWLVANIAAHTVKWEGAATSPAVLSMPRCRRVYAGVGTDVETVEVTVDLDRSVLNSGRWFAGNKLELVNMVGFDGSYMVTGFDVDLVDVTAPLTVTAGTVIDPVPNPPPSTDTPTADGGTGTDPDNPDADADGTGPGQGTNRAAALDPGSTGLWYDPLQGKGSNAHNFWEQRPTHRHKGTDISAPMGTPIYAAHIGRITFAAAAGDAGNMVKIRHRNGIETRYLHLSRFARGIQALAQFADDPDHAFDVHGRQLIGYVGSTGHSTGPHLHFEIRRNGEAIDPDKYIIIR